ncbi:type IV toxin-antitoxin system AbiEi family antitoxin [Microbacterium sp. GXF0217]
MHPTLIYGADGPLSEAELRALRLDGLLFDVGGAFLPADVPETAEVRALSLAVHLRDEYVVSGATAAWVHGAGDARPRRCHVRPHVARRLRASADTDVVLHDGVVPASEIQLFVGVRVLTVPAALVDLARVRGAGPADGWLTGLLALDPSQASPAVELLRARDRLPGKRQAIAAIESAYEEVTR